MESYILFWKNGLFQTFHTGKVPHIHMRVRLSRTGYVFHLMGRAGLTSDEADWFHFW